MQRAILTLTCNALSVKGMGMCRWTVVMRRQFARDVVCTTISLRIAMFATNANSEVIVLISAMCLTNASGVKRTGIYLEDVGMVKMIEYSICDGGKRNIKLSFKLRMVKG